MKRILSSFKQNFLAGLIVTVPFGLTVFILFKLGKWIVGFVSAAPAKLLRPLSELPQSLFQLSTFTIGLLGTVLIVLIAGAIARNIVGRKMVGFGEGLIVKIPFARTIYTVTKQIIEAVFFSSTFKSVRRVAMIEYPRKGIYSIALVTGTVSENTQHNASGKKLVSLFVPTTPNPTSGYYIMLPEEQVSELPITIEEAFKIVMSGGLAINQSERIGPSKEDN